MSRQRKQKLSSRFHEEETMEQNRDPFFNLTTDESMGDEVFPCSDFLDTFTEPSMPPGWNENADWLLEEPASLLSEELLDVNSILGLDDTGLSFLGDDAPSVQNKETFQDLRCTSTPKSQPQSCLDSGIAECSSSLPLKSKIQKTVLHDITDSNKFNIQSANDSFININEVIVEANTPKAIRNKKKQRADFAKVKKSLPIVKKKPDVLVTPSSSQKTSEDDLKSREQLMYYSGLNLYEKALGIAKYINLPSSKLSTYKMVLLAFMKLRLDLEWVDIAYRYEIDTKTAQSVFSTALDFLSVSLVDLLPWQTPKQVNNRTIPKNFYIFVTETSFGKVLTLISELSPPILFVTPLYISSESSSLLLYLECGANFIPGDIICVSNPLEFFKVSNENNTLFFSQIGNPQDLTFLHEAQNVVSNLAKYALSDPSRLTDDVDIAKVMLVSAALTNFNYLKTADTNVLARIYQRSTTYLLHSEG